MGDFVISTSQLRSYVHFKSKATSSYLLLTEIHLSGEVRSVKWLVELWKACFSRTRTNMALCHYLVFSVARGSRRLSGFNFLKHSVTVGSLKTSNIYFFCSPGSISIRNIIWHVYCDVKMYYLHYFRLLDCN